MLPPPPDIINYGNQKKTARLEEPLEQKTYDILDLTVRRRAQTTPNIIDEQHLSAPVEKRRYCEIDKISSQNKLQSGITSSLTCSKFTAEPPLYSVTGESKPQDAHSTHRNASADGLTASEGAAVISQNENSNVSLFTTHQLSTKPQNGVTLTEAWNNQHKTVITNQSVLYDNGSCIGYNGLSPEKVTPLHSPAQQSPVHMPQFSAIQSQGINRLQRNHIEAETIKRNHKKESQIIRQPDASKACADPTVNLGIIAEALRHCLPQRTSYGPQHHICPTHPNQKSTTEANMIGSKPSAIQYLPHPMARQVGNRFEDTVQSGRMLSPYGNYQMPLHFNNCRSGQFLIAPMYTYSPGSQKRIKLAVPLHFPVGESACSVNSSLDYGALQKAEHGLASETSEAIPYMNYSIGYPTMSNYPVNTGGAMRPQSPGSIQSGFHLDLPRPSKPRPPPPMPALYLSQKDGILKHSLPHHPERHLEDNDNKTIYCSNGLLKSKQTGLQQRLGDKANYWRSKQSRNVVIRALLPKALKSDNAQQKSPVGNPLALLANLQPDGKSIKSLLDVANNNLQFRTKSCPGGSNEQSLSSVDLTGDSLDSGKEQESCTAIGMVGQLPNQLANNRTSSNTKLSVNILSSIDTDSKAYTVSTQNSRGKHHEEKSKNVCGESCFGGRNMSRHLLANYQDLDASLFGDNNIHDGGYIKAKMQETNILTDRQRIAEVWSQIWSSTKFEDFDQSQTAALPFVQKQDFQVALHDSIPLFKTHQVESIDDHEEAMKQLGLSKRSEQV